MKYEYNGIEYILDNPGVTVKVKCPLVDDWIADIDCLENQDIAEAFIPIEFKRKSIGKIFANTAHLEITKLLSC